MSTIVNPPELFENEDIIEYIPLSDNSENHNTPILDIDSSSNKDNIQDAILDINSSIKDIIQDTVIYNEFIRSTASNTLKEYHIPKYLNVQFEETALYIGFIKGRIIEHLVTQTQITKQRAKEIFINTMNNILNRGIEFDKVIFTTDPSYSSKKVKEHIIELYPVIEPKIIMYNIISTKNTSMFEQVLVVLQKFSYMRLFTESLVLKDAFENYGSYYYGEEAIKKYKEGNVSELIISDTNAYRNKLNPCEDIILITGDFDASKQHLRFTQYDSSIAKPKDR